MLLSFPFNCQVLSALSPVDMWPLRLVARGFARWVEGQLSEQESVCVGELLAGHRSLVARRELPVLVSQCSRLQSLSWERGGGRAQPRHADALGLALASGLRRADPPLASLSVSGAAALSWSGLAALLKEAGPLSHLRHLEYVAGEAASELTEDAFSHGGLVADPSSGALLGHSTGVELAGALAEGVGCCAGLETIVLRGGGGDAGPSKATLAAIGYRCHALQSLTLDGCISIGSDALAALVCGANVHSVLAEEPRMISGVLAPGLGFQATAEQCKIDLSTPLCSTLTSLDVSGCTAVTDSALGAMARPSDYGELYQSLIYQSLACISL